MTFLNEYVRREDIEKYGLKELKNYYYAKDHRKEYKNWEELPWTGEDFFVLHSNGKNIEVVLRLVGEESSIKYTDNPFTVVWKLLRFKEDDMQGLERQKVIDTLEEALNIYGRDCSTDDFYSRMSIQKPNMQVELRVDTVA